MNHSDDMAVTIHYVDNNGKNRKKTAKYDIYNRTERELRSVADAICEMTSEIFATFGGVKKMVLSSHGVAVELGAGRVAVSSRLSLSYVIECLLYV